MKLYVQHSHSEGKNALNEKEQTTPSSRQGGGRRKMTFLEASPIKALPCFLYKLFLIPHRLQESQFERNKRHTL